ncbi:ABC1 kinase family protein [Methanoplanus limicola]|uniref:ABC-1 domain-containing protein n=1 Tax=Methanoplanus limicola DSM 2279 TaxID=937775 RepID=H1Z1T1_9EURY|nr:AarF/ABC1/UbiB kinase family protein [Methanoplanus limicola]EHQ35398.1 ABC-1 domain-containing protein [Methanoplanus limicola DSM 2279]
MVTRLTRYKQIADVMMNYGFGIVLDEIDPEATRRKVFFKKARPDERSVYERIRLGLEELGPTFVKFGQMLASQSDKLPPEMIRELKKLHEHVKPVPFEELRPTIESYTGRPVEEAFAYFEKKPIAAASIGQVHRAVLHDGTIVAIKIQRPDIEDKIATDTVILENMASRLEKVNPMARAYNLTGLVGDFTRMMKKELDYASEGKNADIFRRNFKDRKDIKFPKIYWEYSGSKMLTMEYIEGIRVDNADGIRIYGYDPKEIASRGFSAYLKMIFEDGFFHLDPHPGNLRVTPYGDLSFLDLGAVAIVRPERRDLFIRLLLAIVDNDVDMLIETLQKLGVTIREENMEDVKDEIYYSLFDSESVDLSSVNPGETIENIPRVLNRYDIKIPDTLMSLLKVIVMVLDIGIKLSPDFNFYEESRPYLREIIEHRYLSKKRLKRSTSSMLDGIDGVLKLPKIISRTLNNISTGNIHVDIVANDVKDLSRTIEQASDKMVLGLVASALVIGASIVIFSADIEYSSWLLYFTIVVYVIAFGLGIAMLVKFLFYDKKR